MKATVVFIDDQYGMGQGFLDCLAQSHNVHRISSATEALKSLAKRGVGLVVISYLNERTLADSYHQIRSHHSKLPILVVTPNDSPIEAILRGDPLTQVARPLTSRQNFLAQAEQLMEYGRLAAFKVGESKVQTFKRPPIHDLFKELDFKVIIDQVLSYFGNKLNCKNMYWVRWKDLWHIVRSEKEAFIIEAESQVRRSTRIRSLFDEDMTYIFNLLKAYPEPSQFDESLSHISLEFDWHKSKVLGIPVNSQDEDESLGLLLIEGFEEGDSQLIASEVRKSLKHMIKYIEFAHRYYEMQTLSFVDDLTCLNNQRYLEKVLDHEISRAKRADQTFSLLFIDIDYFKIVNDTKGHWVGSKLLVEVAKQLRTGVRSCDYAFRYGGDEFVILLVDADSEGGRVVAERLRKRVEDAAFLIDGHEINLTVSIGLATFPEHAKSREQIIQIADQAMYYGKNKSRNIVYVAS